MAMAIHLYNPFETFDFHPEVCFLTGENINSVDDEISVFPQWILDRYALKDKNITMLGGNLVKYQDLKLPCANAVIKNAINPLEEKIENAFIEGYDAVKNVPEIQLFQWMAKLMYGILYNDIIYGIKKKSAKGETFRLSPLLTRKFKILHLMLQSLVVPMEFRGRHPWSIKVVKIKISKDIFNYKDETKNLNFSLGMNDFGIVACLQDNGENIVYNKELLAKISGKMLHAIQFEELCSRFIYSNYLKKTESEYEVTVLDEKIIIETVIIPQPTEKAHFNTWDDKMYSQVLANYWKPWGLTMKDIVQFPNSPISYLIDEYSNEFIEPDSIQQPF